MKRYLAHGPCLNDPGELLFFDAWVWPCTHPLIRPGNLASGDIGYPVAELWPQQLLQALQAAGLALTPGELLWSGAAPAQPGEFSPAMAELAAEAGALGGEGMFLPLHLPAGAADTDAWLTRIDLALRHIAARLGRRGHRVASKQFADAITRVFKPGWQLAVALLLPAFPRLDRAFADVDAYAAFLADPGTLARREALYAWPAQLGRNPLSYVDLVAELVQAAADYVAWIEASGLASGRSAVELLWTLDDPRHADALAAAVQTAAERGTAHFGARGLAPGEFAGLPGDGPAALVSRRPRGYPRF
jgi:hypothetical protein